MGTLKFDRLFETPEQSANFLIPQLIDEYIAYWGSDLAHDIDITPVEVLQELRKHISGEEKPKRYEFITFIHTSNGIQMQFLEDY